MGTVFDYLDWRDDIPLKASNVNIIDYFIFSVLAIIDFKEILKYEDEITLHELYNRYKNNENYDKKLGLIIPNKIITLFEIVTNSKRYKKLKICNYKQIISEEEEIQFSALTIKLTKNKVVCAFSGTDDTIIGWKENLDMMYKPFIPAQQKAIDYLNSIDNIYEVICVGHSKGGNLATVGAAYSKANVKRIYTFDSPGVNKEIFESSEFQKIIKKIVCVVPQSSIIGRLFNTKYEKIVIESTNSGIYQHDPLTWQIMKNQFVHTNADIESIEFQDKLNEILNEMTIEERESFSSCIYKILKSDKNYRLLDLENNVLSLIKGYFMLEKEEKKLVTKVYLKVSKIGFMRKAFLSGMLKFVREQKKK